MQIEEVYAAVGESGIRRLVAAFYTQVPSDDVLGPMYPKDDIAGAEERLGDFLVFRFGGTQEYLEKRGHPRLRMRHAPFRIDGRGRDRWLHLMETALETAAFPPQAREAVLAFFNSTADSLVNSRD